MSRVESDAQLRRRRQKIESPEKLVIGWAFEIPMPAFAPAFDVQWSPYKEKAINSAGLDILDASGRPVTQTVYYWTQGQPPVYDFHVGDIFYKPYGVRDQPWHAFPEVSAAQITDAQPDCLAITLMNFIRGALAEKSERDLSIENFLRLLRTGKT